MQENYTSAIDGDAEKKSPQAVLSGLEKDKQEINDTLASNKFTDAEKLPVQQALENYEKSLQIAQENNQELTQDALAELKTHMGAAQYEMGNIYYNRSEKEKGESMVSKDIA